jgi:uncharacterized membrane protein
MGRLLIVASVLWVAALAAAPLALGSRHAAIAAPAIVVYEAAGLLCHQRPERSFTIAGRQLPVCARCTGLYVAAMVGALAAIVSPVRRHRAGSARLLLAVVALPTAVSWGIERAGLAHVSNMTRATLAVPLGMAAGWLVVSLFAETPGRGERRRARAT